MLRPSRSLIRFGIVALLLASCRPEARSALTERAPTESPSEIGALGAPRGEELFYSARPSAPASLGGEPANAVLEAMQRAGGERGFSLDGDGRLARLAEWFATVTQRVGGSPPLDAIDFATRHLGMIEPLPALLVTVRRSGAWEPPLESLFEHAPKNIRYNRVGAAVLRFGNADVAGVALSASHVDTSFLPRALPKGSRTWFEGELDREYHHPELALTLPNGSTRRVSLGSARDFRTDLDFADAGRSQIELLATGPSGLEVVANFPVYVGTAPPESVDLEREPSENAEAAVATLRELLSVERRNAGLPPLRFDPHLAEVAEAHSADMAEQRFFGHESPTRGDPLRRVRRAGLVIKQLGENVGRGPSARDLHHLLMGSPGHRGNILKPEFTHLGIGVVADDSAGERVLLATQLFATIAKRLPAAQFNSELLAIVNRSRSASHAPPLALDHELEREACRGLAGSPSAPDAHDTAAPALRDWKTVVNGAFDLTEAAREPSLHEPAARRIGVCVTPDEPGALASRTVVIVVSAYPNAPEAAAEVAPQLRRPSTSHAKQTRRGRR